jgi:hypothetical protein
VKFSVGTPWWASTQGIEHNDDIDQTTRHQSLHSFIAQTNTTPRHHHCVDELQEFFLFALSVAMAGLFRTISAAAYAT